MNLNRAIIIGNLTQNPEVKSTPSGQTVANFTVATNRFWNDQQGQRQEQTEFHNVVAWGKLADISGQYLAKGRLCMVEGRLQTRSWDDQSGNRHWKTEIIAENIQLGPRGATQIPTASAPANDPAPVAPVEDEIKIEDIPF